MYVTNISVNHVVSLIDTSTNKVIDTIPVGNEPFGIAFNPTNKDMYVTNVAKEIAENLESALEQFAGIYEDLVVNEDLVRS